MAFRKRFSEKDLAAILEASVPKAEAEKKDDSDDGNDPPNSGTLVLDATCCPADIAYPQGIDLLNHARVNAEKTVDELCEMTGQNPDVPQARPEGLSPSVPAPTSSSANGIRGKIADGIAQTVNNIFKHEKDLITVLSQYAQWDSFPACTAE